MRKARLAVAVMLLGISPLLAADHAVAVSIPRAAVPAQAGLPDFIASSITVGPTDPNQAVPCFNCISGSGVSTLGIAAPASVVTAGGQVTFVITGDNVQYTGACTFAYALSTSLSGPPVQQGTVPTGCYPAIWAAWFPTTAPSVPGRYFLKGTIYTGSGGLPSHQAVVTSSVIVVQ